MYYKLRCNSTQFVFYYKLRNYYKLQRNNALPNRLSHNDLNQYVDDPYDLAGQLVQVNAILDLGYPWGISDSQTHLVFF